MTPESSSAPASALGASSTPPGPEYGSTAAPVRQLPTTSDRTLAITVGRWGGFYKLGGGGCWRVCLGFVAITYLRAEFTHVMRAWLDAGEPS